MGEPNAGSRVQRRAGTKALACGRCRSPKGQNVVEFRGTSAARLALHMAQVHGNARRTIKKRGV